uniref:EGF-like domain-containing protein n=1 Tax=Strongyloides stercoralis TaxID=6248 RepID=A0A0K0DVQ9_STRER
MKYFFVNFLLLFQFIFCIKEEHPKLNKQTFQSLTISGYLNGNASELSIEIYAKIRNVFSIESKNVHLTSFNISDMTKVNNIQTFIKKNINKIKLINPKPEEKDFIKFTNIHVLQKGFHKVLSHNGGPYLIENVVFYLKNINLNNDNEVVINIESSFIIPPFLFQIIKKKAEIDKTNSDKYFNDKISILCYIKSSESKIYETYVCITYITKLKMPTKYGNGYLCRCSNYYKLSPIKIFEKLDSNYNKLLEKEKKKFQSVFNISQVEDVFKPPHFLSTTNEIFHLDGNKKKYIDLKLILNNKYREIFIFIVSKKFSNHLLCSINVINSSNNTSKNCILNKNSQDYIYIKINVTNLEQNLGIKIVYSYTKNQYFQTYKTFITRVFKHLKESRSLHFFYDDCHNIPLFLKKNYDQHLKGINSSLKIEMNGKRIINIYTNSSFKNIIDKKLNVPSQIANILCESIDETKKNYLMKIINTKVIYRIFENGKDGIPFKSYLMFEFNNISKIKFNSFKTRKGNDYYLVKEKKDNFRLWKKYLNLDEDAFEEEFVELEENVGVWIWVWSILAIWMLLSFFCLPFKEIFITKYILKILNEFKYTKEINNNIE